MQLKITRFQMLGGDNFIVIPHPPLAPGVTPQDIEALDCTGGTRIVDLPKEEAESILASQAAHIQAQFKLAQLFALPVPESVES